MIAPDNGGENRGTRSLNLVHQNYVIILASISGPTKEFTRRKFSFKQILVKLLECILFEQHLLCARPVMIEAFLRLTAGVKECLNRNCLFPAEKVAAAMELTRARRRLRARALPLSRQLEFSPKHS